MPPPKKLPTNATPPLPSSSSEPKKASSSVASTKPQEEPKTTKTWSGWNPFSTSSMNSDTQSTFGWNQMMDGFLEEQPPPICPRIIKHNEEAEEAARGALERLQVVVEDTFAPSNEFSPRGSGSSEVIDIHQAVASGSEDLVLRIISSTRRHTLLQMLTRLDPMGMTPLMIACQMGKNNVRLVEILLGAGAIPDATSHSTRKTAAMCSAIGGNVQVMNILEKAGVNWLKRDKSGCNALHHAITAGNVQAVKFLLGSLIGLEYIEDKDGFGWSPLLRAIITGAPEEMIQYLLQNGANANAVDKLDMKSCLIAACRGQDSPSRLPIVRHLLNFGANPTFKNALGETALVIATGKDIRNLIKDKMAELELNPFQSPISSSFPLVPRTPKIQSGRPSGILPQGEVHAEIKATMQAALHHAKRAVPGTASAVQAAAAVERATRGLALAESRDNDTRFDVSSEINSGNKPQHHHHWGHNPSPMRPRRSK